jgi:hypothetical protein
MNFKTLCSNLIPVGTYKAQVTDIKFAAGASKNVLVTLTIMEVPYAKRTHIENIPEKAYSFRLMPVLKACKVDIDRDFGTAEELFKFGFASAKGKVIMINMGIRTYNGQDYNNVTDFSPLPDSTVSAEDVAASFGETPEVKAAPKVTELAEEVTSIPEPSTPAADEPELNIDLSDIDSPF